MDNRSETEGLTEGRTDTTNLFISGIWYWSPTSLPIPTNRLHKQNCSSAIQFNDISTPCWLLVIR